MGAFETLWIFSFRTSRAVSTIKIKGAVCMYFDTTWHHPKLKKMSLSFSPSLASLYLFEQYLRLGVTSTSSVGLPLQDKSRYVFPNCKSLWKKASAKLLNINVNVGLTLSGWTRYCSPKYWRGSFFTRPLLLTWPTRRLPDWWHQKERAHLPWLKWNTLCFLPTGNLDTIGNTIG